MSSEKIIASSMQKKKKRRSNIKSWPLHLFLLPSVVLLIVYNYIPIGGIVVAFQDFKPWLGILKSPFVGLENFKTVFTGYGGLQAIYNTLIISSYKIITGLIAPFVFALLLNEVRQTTIKRSIQTLVYLPHFLNWVILGGILKDILSTSGIINQMINTMGVPSINFFSSGRWFRSILVITNVWKEFGFGSILYLAAIAGVNMNLYEAADIDGAGQFQKAIYITIPAMIPIAIVLTTLSLGSILSAGFDQVLNLYNPILYEKGDIIDTFVYRTGMVQGSFGFATAVGLFKSVVGFFLITTTYSLADKYGNYKIF